MKKWYQTSEAWMGMVTQIIGVITLIGGITSTQGSELNTAIQQIIGAVLTVAATLGYMKVRKDIKLARASAIESFSYGSVNNDDAMQQRQDVVSVALNKAGV